MTEQKALSERLPENIFTEIHQAIGQASVCWKGDVFDAEQASQVAFNLCHFIADEMDKIQVEH
jgi:hypothetical protein